MVFCVLLFNILCAQSDVMGIRTTVFVDENANGFKEDAEQRIGEVGITVTMELLDEDLNWIASSTTDQFGAARFVGLAEGNYYLQFQPSFSYHFSSPITNTNDDDIVLDDNGSQEDTDGDGVTDGLIRSPLITLSLGDEAVGEPPLFIDEDFGPIDENNNWTVDFGVLACNDIEGRLYLDSNDDGCLGSDETFLSANVNLYLCDSGVPGSLGEGVVIASSNDIRSWDRNVCFTDYHEYYIEVEVDIEASFFSSDSCSAVAYSDSSARVGQSDCFSLADLTTNDLHMGFNFMTSSTENPIEASVTLFPNPTDGFVDFESQYLLQGALFYDATGTLVKQVSSQTGLSGGRIDVSELDAGMYYLHLDLADHTRITKLLMIL